MSAARGPSVGRVLALTAITVGLAAAVGIGGDRPARAGRPLVVPGLRFDDVAGLELEAPGAPALIVDLAAGAPRITAPVAAAADESAVRDLISAVAAARFDRVTGAGSRAGLDAPRARLHLRRRTGATVELRVGADVAASSQAWIAVDRKAGLVPSWVAAAITGAPSRLRRTRIFPVAAAVTTVEVHGPGLDLVLAGQPLRRLDDAARVSIEPALRDRLLERLAALTLVDSIDAPRTEAGVTIRVLGGSEPAELRGGGPCPGHADRTVVETSIGVGCVAAAELDEAITAARELLGLDAIASAPLERFDRSAIAAIEIDGTPPVRLEPDGAGWRIIAGDRTWPLDPERARTLAATLTAPTDWPIPPPTGPTERWQIHRTSGDVEIWHVQLRPPPVASPRRDVVITFSGSIIHRDGEPFALLVGSEPLVIGPALRDRTLLSIDPTSLAAITATGTAPATLERGALIGEWLVTSPAGAAAAPTVARLVEALGSLRADAWLTPRDLGAVRRTLRLTVDTAPGAPPRTVTIELGAARRPGCAARIGDDVARLAPADCEALLAPLTAR